jgi:lysozyme family protein
MNISALIAANAARWKAMRVISALGPTLDIAAGRLVAGAAKALYEHVSATTNVPWYVIA